MCGGHCGRLVGQVLVFSPTMYAGAESELDGRRYAAGPSVCTYLVKMTKKSTRGTSALACERRKYLTDATI